MKILIGVVTANIKDYCWNAFKQQLEILRRRGFDVYIVDNSIRRINRPFKSLWIPPSPIPQLTTEACMNEIRRYFLENDYDKLWILESDVFINEDGLKRLLTMGGDVNNLTYYMNLERFDKYSLCVQSTVDNQSKMITPEDSELLVNKGVIKLGEYDLNGKIVTHCGYGCTLIDRKVVEAIEFRTQRSGSKLPYPDSFFHYDVAQKGFTNLLDTDFICEHRNLQGETSNAIKLMEIYNKTTRAERRKMINKK